MDTISDRKYDELVQCFRTMEYGQALVSAALALERAWVPLTEGLAASDFSADEISDILHIAEQWLHLIWESIRYGKATQEELDQFEKLKDCFYDNMEEYGAELDIRADCFISIILSDARYFFDRSIPDLKRCADAICHILDMLLEDMSDEEILKSSDLSQYNSILNPIVSEFPLLTNELMRIDADIELVKRYPENMDEILRKKEEYHRLNIYKA